MIVSDKDIKKVKLNVKKKEIPYETKLSCILKKKENNFFATVMDSSCTKVLISKSCGMLEGVRGTKKYTTVSLESLGKETFYDLFRMGYRRLNIDLMLKFKTNRFFKAFSKGLSAESEGLVNVNYVIRLCSSHNGLRAAKPRRV